MDILVHPSALEMGKAAATHGYRCIQRAIEERGSACIVVATGASQFEMLEQLIKMPIDWSRVNGFHLDEYIGITDQHPASFRRYLKERFVSQVSPSLKSFEYINPGSSPEPECDRLAGLIAEKTIDVAFIGIGENGHLAFNDPPADFETASPYLVIELDEACRRQQLGEGWFSSLDEVPTQAISMSISQIGLAKNIVCTVPDSRKAEAVSQAVNGPLSPSCPASYLQNHSDATLFLDEAAAAKLT